MKKIPKKQIRFIKKQKKNTEKASYFVSDIKDKKNYCEQKKKKTLQK